MTRFFDIVITFVALLLVLPFGIVIAVLLRLTGDREVFYRQQRVGQGGKPFGLFKFVTMMRGSEAMGTGDVTIKDDPRVLPVGKVLRKTKLNELPQLLNILLGDMSLVGPRPQTPGNFAFFPPHAQDIIRRMRPGLTGIGSIVFRDEESIVAASGKPVDRVFREDIGPYKGELEIWYYHHRSLATYFGLILVTAWSVLFPGSSLHRRVWKTLPPLPAGLLSAEYAADATLIAPEAPESHQ